jgi:hypothetical protein
MKPSKTCDNKQLNLFSSTEISSWKAVVFPIFISKKMRQRKIEQMEKFKSLIQAVKPMIELSVESQLAEIDKRIPEAHLVRLIQAAVFKIDTSQIEAKYSFKGQKPYHPKLMLRKTRVKSCFATFALKKCVKTRLDPDYLIIWR